MFVVFISLTLALLALAHVLSCLAPAAPTTSPLCGTTAKGRRKRRVLLLTAHPDDECMFFAPLVLHLTGRNDQVWAVCLSTGDAEKLGSVRRVELEKSYQVLGVPRERVTCVDHPALQDGMTTDWDITVIVEAVGELLRRERIDTLVTFDHRGVSSHPNHIACRRAANLLRKVSANERTDDGACAGLDVFELVSLPLSSKYLGLPGPLVLHLLHLLGVGSASSFTLLSSPASYLRALSAMRQHWTQLVWFRWLFVCFSSYMWGVVLVQVH